jgi:hypothetical protein
MTNTSNTITVPSDPTLPEVQPAHTDGHQVAKGVGAVVAAIVAVASVTWLAVSAFDDPTSTGEVPVRLPQPAATPMSPDALEHRVVPVPSAGTYMSPDAMERWADQEPNLGVDGCLRWPDGSTAC